MTILDRNIQKLEALQGARFLQAYVECSDAIQDGIREMLDIVVDPEVDEDDRDMALFTLADALFPNPHEGKLGMDLEESERMGAEHSEEMRQAVEEMEREEATFSERLRDLMHQQGMTQESLAKKAGMGQPAVSNILNRQCRAQERTVLRFAEALDVTPEELWPGFSPDS